MNEASTLLLSGLAGAALGALFFGGLWWTVRRGASAGCPALWFLASGLLRMSLVVGGFYLIGGGRWPRLAAALVGFIVARLAVLWLTRTTRENQKQPTPEARHAP
jgi:F1F0 ATPase subunit 2